MRNQLGLAALLSLAVACSAASSSPSSSFDAPGDVPIADVTVDALPAALHERAAKHVLDVATSGAAPRWADAKLGARVWPLYRPDIAGVAYYDVPVVTAEGAPLGFVTLSTGAHDVPVVEWSDEGGVPAETVHQSAVSAGAAVGRTYRLGFERVVEDAQGALVASSLDELTAATWPALRDGFVEKNRDAIEKARTYAEERWRTEGAPQLALNGSSGGLKKTAPVLSDVCNISGLVPNYSQIGANVWPNDRSYRSGCGATAWATILAWADNRAAEGDFWWNEYKGIYRQGASMSPSARDARAPLTLTTDAQIFTMEISHILGTYGGSGGSGDILSTQISNISGYLDNVGLGNAIGVDTWLSSVGAAERVDGQICQRGIPSLISVWNPAVGGSNDTFHMVVASRTLKLDGHRWLFVNLGHGVGGRWFDGTVYVYASLNPHAQPSQPTPRRAGINVTSATYGGNCPENFSSAFDPTRIFSGNASPDIASTCDGSNDCTYAIDWQKIGNQYLETGPLGDPAYGCAKTYTVKWTCDDGAERSAFVGAEASGKSVRLTCPPRAINVLSATYGQNCGAAVGNETPVVGRSCNGLTSCNYRVDYTQIGDPAPGCRKDFRVSYMCPGESSARQAYAAPEAGFGSIVSLSCQ